jgi:hypothetical protein
MDKLLQLVEWLVTLTTGFPLALSRLGNASVEDVMKLWREFCARALSVVPVGIYGRELYDQINRLWTTTAVETPCIEWDQDLGKWMIWLRLRGPDEAYPNQYE